MGEDEIPRTERSPNLTHDQRHFNLCLNCSGVSLSFDCRDSVITGKCSHFVSPVWLSLLSVLP